MNFSPTKEQHFKLIDSQAETLARLKRRTEKSDYLTSEYTNKSFRGTISENKFKIISSTIGKGAFCVIIGEILAEEIYVNVEIHTVFKVLLTIMLCFPLIGFSVLVFSKVEEFSPSFIIVAFGQMLMIRYVFIAIAFNILSKSSLVRLRDVLDIEFIKPSK